MSKLGSFELNKIYNMDCLEGLKQIPDNSVDLIVTDPPYNTGIKKTTKGRLKNFFNDKYDEREYERLVEEVCVSLYRVLKTNKAGYIYINWKSLGIWLYYLKKAGFAVKNVIVWDKVIHGLNYQNYAYTYELIIFFIKGIFKVNNKRIEDKNKKYYKDVWHISRKIDNEPDSKHETVKEIKVVKLPIIHGSNENDIVLDPFIGSGTTAVACKQLNRRFIGFEISKEYCDIVNKRLEQSNLKEWLK